MAKFENEKDIRKFLFGEMTEKERAEFEEKFILDADLFGEIKTLEDELIEKYLRGWMNQAERSKFEQKFLTSAKRREKVEFSSQFFNKIEDLKEKTVFVNDAKLENSSKENVWQKLGGLFFAPKIAMAAAFSLLVIVFGGWFLYQNLENAETRFTKNQNSNNSPNTKLIAAPTAELSNDTTNQNSADAAENENTEAIEKQIKNLPKEDLPKEAEELDKIFKKPTPKKPNGSVKKSPEPTQTPIRQTAPNPVLALFAGRTRSEGKNKTLNLPENAQGATLQLNLETVDYKNYIAVLKDADGNLIYQKSNLKAAKSKVDFFVPAAKLRKGDYIIKLSGKNDSGNAESAADFQFRVQ